MIYYFKNIHIYVYFNVIHDTGHLEHIRAEIGADHIGLGADYDGVSALVIFNAYL